MKILKSKGTVPEKDYPYPEWQANPRLPISTQLYTKALENRIASYARVRSVEAAKLALSESGVLLMALPVVTYSQPQFWKLPPNASNPNQFYGGHAVTVVGYNKQGFILRNSWGASWGDNGYVILPFEDWSIVWDVYASVDIETADDTKPDPPQPDPPQPDPPKPEPPKPEPPKPEPPKPEPPKPEPPKPDPPCPPSWFPCTIM
jgi:hypothetical protein